MPHKLYPEQENNVAALLDKGSRYRVTLDLSDTGTGKTLVALEYARRLGRRPFVIVPKVGVSQFAATAKFQEVDLAACRNIEALKTGKYAELRRMTTGKTKFLWQLPQDALFVWDEVHRAGGIESENSELLAMLRAYNIPVHLMSATLATDPLKLRAVGFLLGLHPYKPLQAYYQWCQGLGCSVNLWTQRFEFDKTAKRAEYLQQLHALLAPHSVRLRTDDIVGFPENEIIPTLVDLTARDAAEIQELYAGMKEVVRSCDAATAEVELLRRRQRAEFLKAGIFADFIEDAVEEGKSVVAFLCFRDSLAAVKKILVERGIESVEIVGGQSEAQRGAAVLAFQNNLNFVMLAMVQAAGVSLDLNDKYGRPRTAVLTPDWNSTNMKQCFGRIHRAGSKSKATQHVLMAAGTIETQVHTTVMRKLSNLAHINDGFVADTIAEAMQAEIQGG